MTAGEGARGASADASLPSTFEEDDFKSVCNENVDPDVSPQEAPPKVEEHVIETSDASAERRPLELVPPPPKPKRAPRTSKKPIITKEEIINEAKQELLKEVENKKKEEEEQKKTKRDATRVQCPRCNQTMTEHALRYSHKRYCKGTSSEPVEPPPPPEKEINRQNNFLSREAIDSYITNIRKDKANKKVQQSKSLFLNAV